MRTNNILTPCTARCGAFLSNISIYNFDQSSYKKVEEKTCCLQVFSSSSVQVYNIFVKYQMALGRF